MKLFFTPDINYKSYCLLENGWPSIPQVCAEMFASSRALKWVAIKQAGVSLHSCLKVYMKFV